MMCGILQKSLSDLLDTGCHWASVASDSKQLIKMLLKYFRFSLMSSELQLHLLLLELLRKNLPVAPSLQQLKNPSLYIVVC